MDKINTKRLKVMASYASTNNLDVGFAQQPNPFFLISEGLDLKYPSERPKNYNKIHLDSSLIQSESYDTVTAGEVIEHVFNIDQFIKEIHRVLKTGGLLILSTPNPHYLGDLLEDWLRLKISCEEHIYSFNKYNIENLLRIYGFEKVKVVQFGSLFPVLGFLPLKTIGLFAHQYIYIYKKRCLK